jgi:hypothetical protein
MGLSLAVLGSPRIMCVLIRSNEFDPVTLDTWSAPYIYNDSLPAVSFVPEHAQTARDGTVYHWYVSFGEAGPAGYYPYKVSPGKSIFCLSLGWR